MKIIDISVPVGRQTPLWPNSSGLAVTRIAKIGNKNYFNETHLEMNAHVGTHIDAPLHFVAGGDSIDQSSLTNFIGPAVVLHFPKTKVITAKHLELSKLPKGTKRILFKTENSKLWEKKVKKFNQDYVGLSADAARWIARRGVKLVGMDYLSIAKFSEAVEVHQILLGKGVHVLESIDLSNVKPGKYELICAPIKLADSEAAPTRAFLIKR